LGPRNIKKRDTAATLKRDAQSARNGEREHAEASPASGKVLRNVSKQKYGNQKSAQHLRPAEPVQQELR
jgi:hypothetical protein